MTHCKAVTGPHHQLLCCKLACSMAQHITVHHATRQATHLRHTLHSINERLQKVAKGHASVVIQSWVDFALKTREFLFVLYTRWRLTYTLQGKSWAGTVCKGRAGQGLCTGEELGRDCVQGKSWAGTECKGRAGQGLCTREELGRD